MAKGGLDGFTDAERAAFEWSRRHRASDNRRRGRRSRSRSRGSSRSRDRHRRRDDDSSDSDCPREPYNPLKLAHERGRRRSRSPRQRRRSHSRSQPATSPDKWNHDLYDSDTERVAAEVRYRRREDEKEVTAFQVDTRRGSWRSRAGGVYLPPEHEDANEGLYSDYRRRRSASPVRGSRRTGSYERPDPVYTLD